jgi:UDP-glucose 4-epimerase
VVPRFIAAVRDGDPVPIHGDGAQSRDFTYVANIVDANLRAADSAEVNGAVMNVATGRKLSVNQLADAIGEALGLPVKKEYLSERTGDIRDSWADCSVAQRLLGYEPRVSLEEGLRLAAECLG